jgi:hypothetical protein
VNFCWGRRQAKRTTSAVVWEVRWYPSLTDLARSGPIGSILEILSSCDALSDEVRRYSVSGSAPTLATGEFFCGVCNHVNPTRHLFCKLSTVCMGPSQPQYQHRVSVTRHASSPLGGRKLEYLLSELANGGCLQLQVIKETLKHGIMRGASPSRFPNSSAKSQGRSCCRLHYSPPATRHTLGDDIHCITRCVFGRA